MLVTGAGGEIGHSLVTGLAASETAIITLDVNPLDAALSRRVQREFTGSITDANLLERMLAEFEVECVFHLAALLSTRREHAPEGLAGGGAAMAGRQRLIAASGAVHQLPGRFAIDVRPGDVVEIETPGGGGFGSCEDDDVAAKAQEPLNA